jgi:non-specific serine/threonine protein kinase
VRPDDAEPRYALLATVREFALDALAQHGEAAETEAAHAALMLDLVEAAEPHLFGPDERRWVNRIETELGNIRAAHTWALRHDPATAQRIGAALWVYWAWSGHTAEGRQWLADALAASDATPARVRAKALTVAAGLAFLQGDLPVGAGQIAEGLALAREIGDPLTEARASYVAGGGRMAAGQPDAAIPFLDRSLALFGAAETSTDRGWAAWTRVIRGMSTWQQGQAGEAIGLFEEALTETRAIGTRAETMLILNELAGGLSELGRTRRARAVVAEALTIGANFGELWPVGMMLHALATINAMEGAAFLAAERFGAAEVLLNRAGMYFPPHYQARTARAFALVEAALGAPAFAEALGKGRATPGRIFAGALAEQSGGDRATHAGSGRSRLTPRERAVLRLLAEGRSDRQIGEALFITRRTASKHVSSILTKLGVATRAGAVAAALRGEMI